MGRDEPPRAGAPPGRRRIRLLRGLGTVLLFLLAALLFAPTLVPPFLDRIYYEGPPSGHYDGERFFNPDGPAPLSQGRRRGFLGRWATSDERARWPESVPVTPSVPPPRVHGRAMRVTWVGHATVLVQTAGLNILTDPIWSRHASPFPPLGPERVRAPGVRFDDLPRIDLVLVSHNHYDHLDLPTLRRLWERDRPLIVTSLGNDTIIASGTGMPCIIRLAVVSSNRTGKLVAVRRLTSAGGRAARRGCRCHAREAPGRRAMRSRQPQECAGRNTS